MKIIHVKDFSKFPGPRYANLGSFSGEVFRDEVLLPALKEDQEVEVDFDGVFGYGSSFLEEAFGGLLRHGADRNAVIRLQNNLKSKDPTIVSEVKSYIDDALGANK